MLRKQGEIIQEETKEVKPEVETGIKGNDYSDAAKKEQEINLHESGDAEVDKNYVLARNLIAEEKFNQAFPILTKIANRLKTLETSDKIEKTLSKVYFYLGCCYEESKNPKNRHYAIVAFNNALKRAPKDYAPFRKYLFDIYSHRVAVKLSLFLASPDKVNAELKHEEIRKDLIETLRFCPPGSKIKTILAQEYINYPFGETEEFKQLIRDVDLAPDVNLQEAQEEVQEKAQEEVQEEAQEESKGDEFETAKVDFELGMDLLALNNVDQAIPLLKSAFEILDVNPSENKNYQIPPEANLNLAKAIYDEFKNVNTNILQGKNPNNERFSARINNLDDLCEVFIKLGADNLQLAFTYYVQGKLAEIQKDYPRARLLFTYAIDSEPQAEYYYRRAVVNELSTSSQFTIITDLEEALKLDPSHLEANKMRVRLARENKLDEVQQPESKHGKEVQQSESKHGKAFVDENIELFQSLADSVFERDVQLGDFPSSAYEEEEVKIEHATGNSDADQSYMMGRFDLGYGKFNSALPEFKAVQSQLAKKTDELSKKAFSKACYYEGICQLGMNDPNKAIIAFDRALKAAPNSPAFKLYLYKIYLGRVTAKIILKHQDFSNLRESVIDDYFKALGLASGQAIKYLVLFPEFPDKFIEKALLDLKVNLGKIDPIIKASSASSASSSSASSSLESTTIAPDAFLDNQAKSAAEGNKVRSEPISQINPLNEEENIKLATKELKIVFDFKNPKQIFKQAEKGISLVVDINRAKKNLAFRQACTNVEKILNGFLSLAGRELKFTKGQSSGVLETMVEACNLALKLTSDQDLKFMAYYVRAQANLKLGNNLDLSMDDLSQALQQKTKLISKKEVEFLLKVLNQQVGKNKTHNRDDASKLQVNPVKDSSKKRQFKSKKKKKNKSLIKNPSETKPLSSESKTSYSTAKDKIAASQRMGISNIEQFDLIIAAIKLLNIDLKSLDQKPVVPEGLIKDTSLKDLSKEISECYENLTNLIDKENNQEIQKQFIDKVIQCSNMFENKYYNSVSKTSLLHAYLTKVNQLEEGKSQQAINLCKTAANIPVETADKGALAIQIILQKKLEQLLEAKEQKMVKSYEEKLNKLENHADDMQKKAQNAKNTLSQKQEVYQNYHNELQKLDQVDPEELHSKAAEIIAAKSVYDKKLESVSSSVPIAPFIQQIKELESDPKQQKTASFTDKIEAINSKFATIAQINSDTIALEKTILSLNKKINGLNSSITTTIKLKKQKKGDEANLKQVEDKISSSSAEIQPVKEALSTIQAKYVHFNNQLQRLLPMTPADIDKVASDMAGILTAKKDYDHKLVTIPSVDFVKLKQNTNKLKINSPQRKQIMASISTLESLHNDARRIKNELDVLAKDFQSSQTAVQKAITTAELQRVVNANAEVASEVLKIHQTAQVAIQALTDRKQTYITYNIELKKLLIGLESNPLDALTQADKLQKIIDDQKLIIVPKNDFDSLQKRLMDHPTEASKKKSDKITNIERAHAMEIAAEKLNKEVIALNQEMNNSFIEINAALIKKIDIFLSNADSELGNLNIPGTNVQASIDNALIHYKNAEALLSNFKSTIPNELINKKSQIHLQIKLQSIKLSAYQAAENAQKVASTLNATNVIEVKAAVNQFAQEAQQNLLAFSTTLNMLGMNDKTSSLLLSDVTQDINRGLTNAGEIIATKEKELYHPVAIEQKDEKTKSEDKAQQIFKTFDQIGLSNAMLGELTTLGKQYADIEFKGSMGSYLGVLYYGKMIDQAEKLKDVDMFIPSNDPLQTCKELEVKGFTISPPILDKNLNFQFIQAHKIGPDGIDLDITIGLKNDYQGTPPFKNGMYLRQKYHGDQLIAPFIKGKLNFIKDDLIDQTVRQAYDLIPLGNGYSLGFYKKNPYHEDFKSACIQGQLLFAPYKPGWHTNYCLLAVKALDRMQKMFHSKIDTKPSDLLQLSLSKNKPIPLTFGDVIEDVKMKFGAELKSSSPPRQLACYREIFALVKKFNFNNENAQPFIKALIQAQIIARYGHGIPSDNVVNNVFVLLDAFYFKAKNPTPFPTLARDMSDHFKNAIRLVVESPKRDQPLSTEFIADNLSRIPRVELSTSNAHTLYSSPHIGPKYVAPHSGLLPPFAGRGRAAASYPGFYPAPQSRGPRPELKKEKAGRGGPGPGSNSGGDSS